MSSFREAVEKLLVDGRFVCEQSSPGRAERVLDLALEFIGVASRAIFSAGDHIDRALSLVDKAIYAVSWSEKWDKLYGKKISKNDFIERVGSGYDLMEEALKTLKECDGVIGSVYEEMVRAKDRIWELEGLDLGRRRRGFVGGVNIFEEGGNPFKLLRKAVSVLDEASGEVEGAADALGNLLHDFRSDLEEEWVRRFERSGRWVDRLDRSIEGLGKVSDLLNKGILVLTEVSRIV